ncbi:MAG: hypothetical protein ABIT38_01095, partial [Gemmatimonadaceae bacterium]
DLARSATMGMLILLTSCGRPRATPTEPPGPPPTLGVYAADQPTSTTAIRALIRKEPAATPSFSGHKR